MLGFEPGLHHTRILILDGMGSNPGFFSFECLTSSAGCQKPDQQIGLAVGEQKKSSWARRTRDEDKSRALKFEASC